MGSDTIFFYGEIAQSEESLTTTDMGSGKFATIGCGNSGYIYISFLDTNGTARNYTASFGDSNSTRYDHMAFSSSGTSWGSYVYLGGPDAGGFFY
ncbi:hypothetical protein NA56DRAFT_703431 [Hyaloscypha hepaticicola]|uniref:Neprosin PEP catalytic domain-containing protein n=1 Tax=Hyaloscypha hepaticicola TaxID=2082293 RepID=A0A2J6Q6F1_9HELO|nr:hypothetical protein NA56DRAFT_703431 [Hyaloscypha hepaticicola]